MCSCIEFEERVTRKRFRSCVDDDRVAAQRGEQTVRADSGGDISERTLQFRRTVQRIHRVSTLIHRQVRIGHVVDNESDGVGDRTSVNIRRGDATPSLSYLDRDVGAVSDADLDEAVVPAKPVGEGRFPITVHVEIFINNAT